MTHVLPFERRGEPVGEVGEVASNEQQTYRGISDMATANLDKATLKLALKEALAETLHEQLALFQEVFAEVLEDFALVEAIREGRKTKNAPREEVFRLLQDKA